MFKIFYANSDATLYQGSTATSATSLTNTGLDEILEVGKYLSNDGTTLLKSRSVIKFDINEIQETLQTYNVSLNSCKFVMQLFTTQAKNLPSEYTIDAKIVAQPWINGTGYLGSRPIVSNGVQWAKPYESWSFNAQSGSMWISSSQQIQINSSSLYVSGSGTGGSWLWQSGSGIFNISNFNQVFFTQPGLQSNESFSYRPTDIYMDVTDAISLWISGSGGHVIQNNGFLLKFSDQDESNSAVTGYIRFFSRDTHTIYVPRLIMYFDNSEYDSNLENVNLESFLIFSKLKPEYKDTEIVKIRIYGRDKFPRKSPNNLFPTQTIKKLPITTYYAVRDAATDEYIIPYDNIYNKVSCDNTSNYIYVDLNGFMPERYYRLEFMITDGFTKQYIDDQIYFKVVR